MAENKEVLENLAQSGEVASAEEYLETVLSGSDLPSQRAGVDHFTQFFPVVPQLATEHPKLLHELRATMAGRIPRRRSPVSRRQDSTRRPCPARATLRWLWADTSRALLILLDEADAFLDADAEGARSPTPTGAGG